MEIKDKYYLELINLLKSKVSEFTSIFDEDEGIYPILGDFGQFIITNLNNREIIKKSFQFINEAIENGDTLTIEAISIQLFEQFFENDELISFAKNNLNDNSLFIFNKYLDKYTRVR